MASVDNLTLRRWRDLDAIIVLNSFADHIKIDRTFLPTTSRLSSRWIVHAAGQDWEILCTGPKFWDTRAERGGGGAVDLVMHLHRISFKAAVKLLKDKGL
jgi:hypothetical protein